MPLAPLAGTRDAPFPAQCAAGSISMPLASLARRRPRDAATGAPAS